MIPIPFVIPSINGAQVSLSEYSIQNGQINLGFSVESANSYDFEGCLSPGLGNDTLYLSEPTSIGSGQIGVVINSSSEAATISPKETISSPFSFWFDLEYAYGYTGSLANETISRDQTVLRSSTALINSNSPQILSLQNPPSNLRSGRYIVQGYFDSSSGFGATETRALLLNDGRWFWLSSCSPFTIGGLTFSKQVDLAQDPSTWPSSLYFMYESNGIDSYSIVPLQINLARLDFYGQPGNVELTDFTYSIANNSDIEASGPFGGSVYVIAKSYPLALTVTPMIGSESFNPLEINISKPLTDSHFYIPIGKLTVEVLNNSKPDVGIQVSISNSKGASLSSIIASSGNTSFYLPSSFYNITILKNGVAHEGNATVVDGSDTVVIFLLTSTEIPSSYLDLLVIPLVLGLGLNIWTWIVGPRRSKYKPLAH
jgi:hypothetical protein